MKIIDILTPDAIRTNIPEKNKTDVISSIIDLLTSGDRVIDKEKVRNAIFEREKIMSTGVGGGFAIPHGKTDGVVDLVGAIATTALPIDFESLDEQPVRIIFLLVGPESMVGPHIKILSRISRLMNREDFRNRLLAAASPSELYELIKQEELAYLES